MQPNEVDWGGGEDDGGPWVPYSEYMADQEDMLDLFQIPGPGPPFHLLLPPPPDPDHWGECSQPASHFATCPSRVEVSLTCLE